MHKEIVSYLSEQGYICRYEDEENVITIDICVEARDIQLVMKLPRFYPYEFPEIYCYQEFDFLVPHVYTNKQLCLFDENEETVYPDRYLEIAKISIERAIKLFQDSILKNNLLEYNLEAVSYWNTKAESFVVMLRFDESFSHYIWAYQMTKSSYVCSDSKIELITFIRTIIDKDILTSDNIARHLCGADKLLSENKAEAISNYMLEQYPTMRCEGIYKNVLEIIEESADFFDEYDIVFVAVGNWMLEKKFVKLYKEGKIKQCVLVWVEPYLIAGHVIVLNTDYTEKTNEYLFDEWGNFKISVVENSKQYMKSEAGCQSAYAPYAGFELQKFILDFVDLYHREVYEKECKANYVIDWFGRMKWARMNSIAITVKEKDGSFACSKTKYSEVHDYLTRQKNNNIEIELFYYIPGRCISWKQLCEANKKYKNNITDSGILQGLKYLESSGLVICVDSQNELYQIDFEGCKLFVDNNKWTD